MAIFISFSASLFCIFFFFSLLSHQTMSQPQHLYTFCDLLSENFTETSPYKSNRETLLSSLRDHSSLGTYSNATVGLSPDTVQGMFLCRGDITKSSCSDCVKTATLEITKNDCTYQKNATIYYAECMVRYSNISFFSLVENFPHVVKSVSYPNSRFSSFRDKWSKKVEELINLTASSSSLSSSTPYYMSDKSRFLEFGGLYTLDTMVQCSPDLDPANCGVCLRFAVQQISECCNNTDRAYIFFPKCLLKYDFTSMTQSGSSSINIIKGKEIFARIFITAMITLVLAHSWNYDRIQ